MPRFNNPAREPVEINLLQQNKWNNIVISSTNEKIKKDSASN